MSTKESVGEALTNLAEEIRLFLDEDLEDGLELPMQAIAVLKVRMETLHFGRRMRHQLELWEAEKLGVE